MAPKSDKNFFERVYQQLSSIKLAIILIILLGILSILAIAFGEYFPTNFINWENMYAQKMGIVKFEILRWLGVFNPYHSFWYVFLLGLLMLNILVCTYERTKGLLKIAFKPSFQESAAAIKNLKNSAVLNAELPAATALEKIEQVLDGRGYKVTHQESKLFATKGGFARIGFILFHLGLVASLLGGLLISAFGYSEYLWGTTGSILTPKNADFSVRVDDFKIETNQRGQVKDYLATLTVLEDSQEVKQKVVEVNYPLRHRGYTFYQSSYRTQPHDIQKVKVRLQKSIPVPQDTLLTLKLRENVRLPELELTLGIVEFIPDFRIAGDSIYSASGEARNPAIKIFVHPQGQQPYFQWLFAKFPQFHQDQVGSIKLQFVDFEQALYTGLQVSRKPGSSLIWVGIIGMTLGLLLSFYIFHRRIWALAEQSGSGKTRLAVGGNINKNQVGFKQEFKRLVEQLKLNLK